MAFRADPPSPFQLSLFWGRGDLGIWARGEMGGLKAFSRGGGEPAQFIPLPGGLFTQSPELAVIVKGGNMDVSRPL